MSSNTHDIVGWDIGGVNIKAAHVLWQAGTAVESRVVVRPFEIWRELENLPAVLGRIGEDLGVRPATAMALTMTAELADAFRTKREGVLAILDAMGRVFPENPIYPLSLQGHFTTFAEARERPLEFAANNWLASALYLAERHPFCTLMDIGSTTTDIIPIREGRVVCTGRTDTERLTSGELVYSGILRTNPNTIACQVPVNGHMCRTAAELFTLMADVHLLLGTITPEEYTCPTADGRAKTPEDARERLARLACADGEMLQEEQTLKLARYLFEKQVQQLTEALFQVLSNLEDGYRMPLAAAGAGAFLVDRIGSRLGIPVLDLGGKDGFDAATALPARAAACLLARKMEEGLCSKP